MRTFLPSVNEEGRKEIKKIITVEIQQNLFIHFFFKWGEIL